MLSLKLVLFDFIIFVSIIACNDDIVGLVGVEGNLEVLVQQVSVLLAHLGRNSGDADVDLGDNLALLPLPENEHPVGLASQSDQVLTIGLRLEADAQELLSSVVLALNVLVRDDFLELLRVNIVDGALGSLSLLTDGQVFLGS